MYNLCPAITLILTPTLTLTLILTLRAVLPKPYPSSAPPVIVYVNIAARAVSPSCRLQPPARKGKSLRR